MAFVNSTPVSYLSRGRRLGANYLGGRRCEFTVWAPFHERVDLHVVAPADRVIVMQRDARGYHHTIVEEVEVGARYVYRLSGENEHPDPASRLQPEGVHAASAVVDPNIIPLEDAEWSGVPLADMILYELHIGTFTTAGTFGAAIPFLDELRELGITAVEIMPVAQFPGTRNWGYDGVYPFAVQNSYGGPEGLRRFVNACHARGLAVVLDVVYNHLGPEGNYLGQYGPYFTDRYRTPWGSSVNFDGPQSDEVRHYFIENALYWFAHFHIDALRLDSVEDIKDFSARPFLKELVGATASVAADMNRRLYLIAESDLNDPRIILPNELGGYGVNAQWSDDFHHAVHSLLTGERQGYYEDFGKLRHVAKAFSQAYVYDGDYSAYRQRRHGAPPNSNEAQQFVISIQNHDQIGNRMLGERLNALVSFDALKLASAALLFAPYPPLLFMGQEYGELAPFLYFTSHSDAGLIEGVRKGRKEEFRAFAWKGEPPDPQDEGTFIRSRLHHELAGQGAHAILRRFYQELIALRRNTPALRELNKRRVEAIAYEDAGILFLRRWCDGDEVFIVFTFGAQDVSLILPVPAGVWHKKLDSQQEQWLGAGSSLPERLNTQEGTSVRLQASACALYRLAVGTDA